MPDTTVDPLPPLKPAEKYPRLEVDTFCLECGYNLHSQAVVRDERLGIFVCRCPECGRFHPAGVGMTATRVWMQRLATLLLVFWVLLVLFAVFWIEMGFGAIAVGHLETFLSYKAITFDGQEVEWNTGVAGQPASGMVIKGTTRPAAQWRTVATHEIPANEPGRANRSWWDVVPFVLSAVAIGFITGALLVVFLWHWRKPRYAWALLLPIAANGFVAAVFLFSETYEFVHPYAIRIIGSYVLLEAVAMIAGIRLGRPIVRTILRMVIPPRPRQHFAFLWLADGKNPPPVRT